MAASRLNSGPIGYYVHHHGTGHMRRAISICRHITQPVLLFSAQAQPADLPQSVTYIELVSDVVANYRQSASGVLHYTPYAEAVFKRNQQFIDAWQKYGIKDMYVDVSIEVAVLAKLYGLTVGHALMPGRRIDLGHTFGYQAADYLLAHYAAELDDPASHATMTPVLYSGGISRLRKHQPAVLKADNLTGDGLMPRTIVVTVSPKAERDLAEAILKTAAHYKDTIWHVIGQNMQTDLPNVVTHGVIADPEVIYEQADVIVGSGGMNTIMEAASMGKPFVCIPEDRPYDEQAASGRALQRLRAAVVMANFPEPDEWPVVCATLGGVDLNAFTELVDDNAAARAAQIIESGGQPDN